MSDKIVNIDVTEFVIFQGMIDSIINPFLDFGTVIWQGFYCW
jgi:hypothetical protein